MPAQHDRHAAPAALKRFRQRHRQRRLAGTAERQVADRDHARAFGRRRDGAPPLVERSVAPRHAQRDGGGREARRAGQQPLAPAARRAPLGEPFRAVGEAIEERTAHDLRRRRSLAAAARGNGIGEASERRVIAGRLGSCPSLVLERALGPPAVGRDGSPIGDAPRPERQRRDPIPVRSNGPGCGGGPRRNRATEAAGKLPQPGIGAGRRPSGGGARWVRQSATRRAPSANGAIQYQPDPTGLAAGADRGATARQKRLGRCRSLVLERAVGPPAVGRDGSPIGDAPRPERQQRDPMPARSNGPGCGGGPRRNRATEAAGTLPQPGIGAGLRPSGGGARWFANRRRAAPRAPTARSNASQVQRAWRRGRTAAQPRDRSGWAVGPHRGDAISPARQGATRAPSYPGARELAPAARLWRGNAESSTVAVASTLRPLPCETQHLARRSPFSRLADSRRAATASRLL
jgi:hypothetical protein